MQKSDPFLVRPFIIAYNIDMCDTSATIVCCIFCFFFILVRRVEERSLTHLLQSHVLNLPREFFASFFKRVHHCTYCCIYIFVNLNIGADQI